VSGQNGHNPETAPDLRPTDLRFKTAPGEGLPEPVGQVWPFRRTGWRLAITWRRYAGILAPGGACHAENPAIRGPDCGLSRSCRHGARSGWKHGPADCPGR
jgi:hypothetical protein